MDNGQTYTQPPTQTSKGALTFYGVGGVKGCRVVVHMTRFVGYFRFMFRTLGVFVQQVVTMTLVGPIGALLPRVFGVTRETICFGVERLYITRFGVGVALPDSGDHIVRDL